VNRGSLYRHTGPLVTNKADVAAIEAKNALLQFDELRRLIGERGSDLRLTPDDICNLQRITVQGIFACAGSFRTGPINISHTPHQPPEHPEVPLLVQEMCDYANSVSTQPIHCSAYLMWRLNWIHPFADGNGRTSRAISYLALCCGYAMEFPGRVTVPDLISVKKQPYYDALDAADAACKDGRLDVREMESLIEELLRQQIMSSAP
jgi:Fic family protein